MPGIGRVIFLRLVGGGALLSTLFSISGCGAGIVGLAVLLSGSGGGGGGAANAPPSISLVPPLQPQEGYYGGDISLEFTLDDPDGDPVDLEAFFFRTDGRGERIEAPAAADVLRRTEAGWEPAAAPLAAPPTGARYRLVWHSPSDVRRGGPGGVILPAGTWGLILRAGARSYPQSFPLPLDNAPPPEVEIASMRTSFSQDWREGDTFFASLEVRYRFSDIYIPGLSDVEKKLYVREESDGEFQPAAPSFEITIEHGRIDDESGTQSGEGQRFWDTNQILFEEDAAVEIRAWRLVEGRRTRGAIATSPPFRIDNTVPLPEVLSPRQGEDAAGDVRLDLAISHPYPVDYALEILFTDDLERVDIDPSGDWLRHARPCRPVAEVPEDAFLAHATPPGALHRFIWSSFRDTHDGLPWPEHRPFASVRTMLHARARNARSGLRGPWVHSPVFTLDQRRMATVAGSDPLGDTGPARGGTFSQPVGLARGPGGALFVADAGSNRIRRVSPLGVITTFAGTGSGGHGGDGGPAEAALLQAPRGVAAAPDGSVLIADTSNHRIRKVSPRGIITTSAGTGTAGRGGDGGQATEAMLRSPASAEPGPDGSILIADSGNHSIRRVSSQGVIATVAGTGTAGSGGDGGPAIEAALNFPQEAVRGPDGAIYIADTGNHRIRRISPQGIMDGVAGTGVAGFGGDGGPARSARLRSPSGLAVAPDGSLLIADAGNHRLRRVTATGTIDTVAGTGEPGFAGDGGPAAGATLQGPSAVAIAPDGSVFIADAGNRRIRGISVEGIIDTVAGGADSGQVGDGGPATESHLRGPLGVALGSDGSILLADAENHRLRRISPEGVISTLAGTGEDGDAGDGGPAAGARMRRPSGIALAPDGSVYIADAGSHRVRIVSTSGAIVPFAGTGVAGSAGDGGPAVEAELREPLGLAWGLDGSLLIADAGNHRIRRVSLGGIITTLAGTGDPGDGGDGGPAAGARLWKPSGMAVAPDGSITIADTLNNRLRRISPLGIISTLSAGADALREPSGVAWGPDGALFIADTSNHRILRVLADGTSAVVAGTGERGFSGDGGPAGETLLSEPWGLALGPDRAVHFSDRGNHRLRRFEPWP